MEERKKSKRAMFFSVMILCILGILGYFLFLNDEELGLEDQVSVPITVSSTTQVAGEHIDNIDAQVKGEQISAETFQESDVQNASSVVNFSAHILNAEQSYTAEPGQEVSLQISVQNTGAVWEDNLVSANVVGGVQKNAPFKHNSWLTNLRTTHVDQSQLFAGQTATFSFMMSAPLQPGVYTFQTMIVYQQGFLFENIGDNIYTLELTVVSPEQSASTQDAVLPVPVNNNAVKIDQDVEQKNDVLPTDEVAIPSYSGGNSTSSSGLGSQPDSNPTTTSIVDSPIEIQTDGSATSSLEFSTELVTTTLYTTSSIFAISGFFSTGTADIWVQGTSSPDMALNYEAGTWVFRTELESATNTFSFVAVDETATAQSSEYIVTVIYTEPTSQIETPEFTIDDVDTANVSTSSTYLFSGTFNSSTNFIFVNGTSTEQLQMDFDAYTWEFVAVLEVGDNIFVFSAWDVDGIYETSTTVVVQYTPPEAPRVEPHLEPEIISPTIALPTASSTYTTTSTLTILGGSLDPSLDSVVVFNSTTQQYLDSSVIITSSTWQATLELTESGVYVMEVYGISNGVTSTPAYIEIEYIHNTPVLTPMLNSFMITADSDSLSFEIDSSDSDYVSIEFSVAPDDTYMQLVCGDGAVWHETSDISVLGSFDIFMELFDAHPCVQFQVTTTLGAVDVLIDPAFGYLVIDARAQAHVDLESSEWLANTAVWGEDSGGPEVFPEGAVVLSEIAWMGTQASANDEWFEICNADTVYIEVTGWNVLLGDDIIAVVGSIVLAPTECLVFERTDQTTISDYNFPDSMVYTGGMGNSGEHLRLLSAFGNVMDELDARLGWFAGDNSTKDAMVRVDPTISGNEAGNWCSFSVCPDASLKGFHNGLDADGVEILGSVGNMEIITRII